MNHSLDSSYKQIIGKNLLDEKQIINKTRKSSILGGIDFGPSKPLKNSNEFRSLAHINVATSLASIKYKDDPSMDYKIVYNSSRRSSSVFYNIYKKKPAVKHHQLSYWQDNKKNLEKFYSKITTGKLNISQSDLLMPVTMPFETVNHLQS